MSGETSKFGWFLRILAPPLVLIGGVAGFVALASLREPPAPADTETQAPLVETASVGEMNGVLDIESDGLVVPYRSISMAAQVEGRIVEKTDKCRAGRVVSEGDLLLRIDPATFELAVERLSRERDQATANLKELGVQIENAASSIAVAQDELELKQADVERIENLQGRGVSTQQSLDAAKIAAITSRKALVTLQNEKRLLEAQRARLEESIKLAEAKLEEAKLDLKRSVIRAPGDGVIVSTEVEEGDHVAPGEAAIEFEDTSAVEVRTNLEMRTLAWLRANAPTGAETVPGPYELPRVPVTVLYEVLGNVYSWSGMLDRVEGVGVDERTRTIPVRVLVEEPQSVSMRSGSANLPVSGPPALVRGMYVTVMLHSQPVKPMLRIPEKAVQPDDSVWAVRAGELHRFPLLGSRIFDGEVLVPSAVTGITPGERVVVSPLPMGVDGMEVRVHQRNPSPERPVPEQRTVARDSSIWPAAKQSASDREAPVEGGRR